MAQGVEREGRRGPAFIPCFGGNFGNYFRLFHQEPELAGEAISGTNGLAGKVWKYEPLMAGSRATGTSAGGAAGRSGNGGPEVWAARRCADCMPCVIPGAEAGGLRGHDDRNPLVRMFGLVSPQGTRFARNPVGWRQFR